MGLQMNDVLVYIEKEQLLALLRRAYDEGCYGYADLRDSAVATLVDEYMEEQAAQAPKTVMGRSIPYPDGLQCNVSPSLVTVYPSSGAADWGTTASNVSWTITADSGTSTPTPLYSQSGGYTTLGNT
jgi:hypothetical protein